MANLFSIFDPVTSFNMSLNWVSAILSVTLVFPAIFWVLPSQTSLSMKKLLSILFKEFSSILGALHLPGSLMPSISVFIFIWFNNFLGLGPYIFTASSHMSLTLAMALPLWVGHVVMAWIKSTNSMLAHLVPLGSPMALSPFMVLIEIVSAVIRPVTLSVRLAANMVAGHLLMVLLSSPATSSEILLVATILSALVLLAVLETAVATIQSYVFSILSVLYVNEVNSPVME